MVKRELVEGLKNAIERGEPTEKAMMSFYNAGYGKKDIEDASKVLMFEKFGEKPENSASVYGEKPEKKEKSPKIKKSNNKVSDYVDTNNKKSKGYIWIIVLSIIILIIIILLSSIIFFRQSIIDFFNNLNWFSILK